jgi:hypothetical protein
LYLASVQADTTTHTTTIVITGTASDASGIASVKVNGKPANGTDNWSANVTLTERENTLHSIGNGRRRAHTTAAVTVRYEPCESDLNRDDQIAPPMQWVALEHADATIALQLAATGSWDPAADVDGDRRTSLDALMILQAAAETQI